MEDSDEDPRDYVDPEPEVLAAEVSAEVYQLPLREELQQRAAEAVAAAKESAEPHTFDQDVDYGNGEDSIRPLNPLLDLSGLPTESAAPVPGEPAGLA
eukprot:5091635-Amphidinium_carterae.1